MLIEHCEQEVAATPDIWLGCIRRYEINSTKNSGTYHFSEISRGLLVKGLPRFSTKVKENLLHLIPSIPPKKHSASLWILEATYLGVLYWPVFWVMWKPANFEWCLERRLCIRLRLPKMLLYNLGHMTQEIQWCLKFEWQIGVAYGAFGRTL